MLFLCSLKVVFLAYDDHEISPVLRFRGKSFIIDSNNNSIDSICLKSEFLVEKPKNFDDLEGVELLDFKDKIPIYVIDDFAFSSTCFFSEFNG